MLFVLLGYLLVNNYRGYTDKARDDAAAAEAAADVNRRASADSAYFDPETDDDAFGAADDDDDAFGMGDDDDDDDEFGTVASSTKGSMGAAAVADDDEFKPDAMVGGVGRTAGIAVNRVKVLFCTA
jgi:hypothetical protein